MLQNNMSLNGTTNQDNTQLNQSQVNNFYLCIFKLVSELVSFKYNISRGQYDELDVGMNNKVSFPKWILSIIIKGDFLHALFVILNKLLEIK